MEWTTRASMLAALLSATAAGAETAANTQGVTIDEFWAWFTPGMWTVDMEGKIHTLIRTGSGVQLDVRAYGKNSGGSGKEDNWREAYDRAFKDYAVRFDEAFSRSGL